MAGAPAEPWIVPFRGAYLRLKPEKRELVRSLIYPVPDPSLPFLGVHLTRHTSGDVLVGPTALLAPRRLGSTLSWPGSYRMFRRFWRTGLTEIRHAASRRAFVRRGRGLRARATGPRRRLRLRGLPRPGGEPRRLP